MDTATHETRREAKAALDALMTARNTLGGGK